jgi:hypothetical protein
MASISTRPKRIYHQYTGDEREIIRRDYRGTRESAKAIAQAIGATEYGVRGQIYKMGLAKKTDRRNWDPKQDNELRKLLPHYCVEEIARRMNRSVNSIVVRAKRLRLHRRSHDDWFTKKEVCEILGVDHHWVQRRIDSGALKATYHNGCRPSQKGMAMWHIEQEDLRTFIRRYPQDLEGRNVDLIAIVEILAGIEVAI